MRDMRNPNKKHPVPYNINSAEETQFDGYQFMAFLFSLQGVFFKAKIFFFLAVLCFMSSLFNKKRGHDYKQYMMISSMVVFGLINIYFIKTPEPKPTPAQSV